MKKLALLILFISLYTAAGKVSASSFISIDEECIIVVDTEKDVLEGEIIEIYKVGEIDPEAESLTFVLTKDFERTEVDLNTQGKAREISSLCELLMKASNEVTPLGRIPLNEKGEVRFVVRPGMYLIKALTAREAEIQPILVGVPNMNPEKNGWEYDIKIEPKVRMIENNDIPATGDIPLKEIVRFGVVLFVSGIIMIVIIMIKMKKKTKR